jgi:hypothetical protein
VLDPSHDQPLLRTSRGRVLRHRHTIDLRRDDPYFAVFETTRPLHLLAVSDADSGRVHRLSQPDGWQHRP